MTDAFSKTQLAQMHDTLTQYVTRGEMPGLVTLLCHRNQVVVDCLGAQSVENDRPMQRDTIFRIASMTKPITAVATMLLIEENKLQLDAAIDEWLPELAQRRVLKTLSGRLDDTVAAKRSITVRDLLTFRMGFGSVMRSTQLYPIQKAIRELHLGGDVPPHPHSMPPADEWLRRLGTLPLMYQPGERWLYHTGSDVLAVLIARVSGKTFGEFLRERIFVPLQMHDTGFCVPHDKLKRLAASYLLDRDSKTLRLYDGVDQSVDQSINQSINRSTNQSAWGTPSSFESGSAGLVSTADDYLNFYRMLLQKGQYIDKTRDKDTGANRQLLSPASIELMSTDQLTPQQKVGAEIFFGEHRGWGFGVAVNTQRNAAGGSPGRFGWDGMLGTSAYVDPQADFIGILLTQRMMQSAEPPPVFNDFWNAAYRSLAQ